MFIAVNGLIAEKMVGRYAKVPVTELIGRMVTLGLDKKEIKKRGWSNIGSLYEKAGWDVSYSSLSWDDDGPGFDPYYTFSSESQSV